MKLSEDDLRAIAGAVDFRHGAVRTGCPPQQDLIKAASGQSSRVERGRVADHLIACADCAEEYRLLTALQPWAANAARAIAPTASRSQQPRLLWPSLIPYAAAAALFLTALGLGTWALLLRNENQRLAAALTGPPQGGGRAEVPAAATGGDPTIELRRRLEEAVQRSNQVESQLSALEKEARTSLAPQLNVPIVDLEPDALRGAAPPVKVVALPAGTEIITLVLATTTADRKFAEYGLEIAGRAGSIVWRGSGLRKSPYDTFTVALPRRLIPDGEYRVSLVGIDGGRREVLDRYAIRTETK